MSWGARVIGLGSVLDLLESVQIRFDDDVAYVVGTNVEYALYLETGTSKMPAYPWFRPAIEEFRRSPRAFVAKNTQTSLAEIDSMEAAVTAVALALERQMVENVSADRGGGRSPGTDPDHPRRQTGNLAASISAERIR